MIEELWHPFHEIIRINLLKEEKETVDDVVFAANLMILERLNSKFELFDFKQFVQLQKGILWWLCIPKPGEPRKEGTELGKFLREVRLKYVVGLSRDYEKMNAFRKIIGKRIITSSIEELVPKTDQEVMYIRPENFSTIYYVE